MATLASKYLTWAVQQLCTRTTARIRSFLNSISNYLINMPTGLRTTRVEVEPKMLSVCERTNLLSKSSSINKCKSKEEARGGPWQDKVQTCQSTGYCTLLKVALSCQTVALKSQTQLWLTRPTTIVVPSLLHDSQITWKTWPSDRCDRSRSTMLLSRLNRSTQI